MCGRYNLITDAKALFDAFQVDADLDAAQLHSYNVAPATAQPVIPATGGGGRARRWAARAVRGGGVGGAGASRGPAWACGRAGSR